MKNYLFIWLLFIIVSCKINKEENQEVEKSEVSYTETKNDEIFEIGRLYNPVKMSVKQTKSRSKSINENYQITLINSAILDSDSENLENNAKKIANLYYKNLVRNIKPLFFDTIKVNIEHKSKEVDIFEYTKDNFINKPIEIPINSKFRIKVNIDEHKGLKYSLVEIETLNLNEDVIVLNEKSEDETICFYLYENNNGFNTLVMQSNSKTSIMFKLEIQEKKGKEFEEIPNVGTHKDSRTTENWAKKTNTIRLSNFTIKE